MFDWLYLVVINLQEFDSQTDVMLAVWVPAVNIWALSGLILPSGVVFSCFTASARTAGFSLHCYLSMEDIRQTLCTSPHFYTWPVHILWVHVHHLSISLCETLICLYVFELPYKVSLKQIYCTYFYSQSFYLIQSLSFSYNVCCYTPKHKFLSCENLLGNKPDIHSKNTK